MQHVLYHADRLRRPLSQKDAEWCIPGTDLEIFGAWVQNVQSGDYLEDYKRQFKTARPL